MTDKEIQESFYDSQVYQNVIDKLIDELHELTSQGRISAAKEVANQIRHLQKVG